MRSETEYSNREIDQKIVNLHEKLDLIITQTTATNGTVKWHTKILIAFSCVIGTLLVVNGSPFVQFLTMLIK